MVEVRFKLNGKPVAVDVKPNENLLDVLRYKLGVKSVKRGCERAECGVCTVLLDGLPVYSCTVLAVQVEGREVTTVEGLSGDPVAKVLVDSLIRVGGIQCGFCAPGLVLTAYALLKRRARPSRDEIAKAIEGNLCRCTGYRKIIDAVAEAASQLSN